MIKRQSTRRTTRKALAR